MEGCAEDGTRGLEELRKMGLPSKVLDQVGRIFEAVQLNSDPERWRTGSGLYGTIRSQTEKTVRQRLLKVYHQHLNTFCTGRRQFWIWQWRKWRGQWRRWDGTDGGGVELGVWGELIFNLNTLEMITMKLNIADPAQTGYCSTFHCSCVRPCVHVSQAWHLNFSQLFDDLGHENHIFSESRSSRLTTLITLTT